MIVTGHYGSCIYVLGIRAMIVTGHYGSCICVLGIRAMIVTGHYGSCIYVLRISILSLCVRLIRLWNCSDRMEMSWSWSYGSWIYNYLCNHDQCISPLKL